MSLNPDLSVIGWKKNWEVPVSYDNGFSFYPQFTPDKQWQGDLGDLWDKYGRRFISITAYVQEICALSVAFYKDSKL